jgi:hypothetical protein
VGEEWQSRQNVRGFFTVAYAIRKDIELIARRRNMGWQPEISVAAYNKRGMTHPDMSVKQRTWLGDALMGFALLLGVYLMLLIFSSALLP